MSGYLCKRPQSFAPNRHPEMRMQLTDDELSALICACQLAENTEAKGTTVRPPWGRCGTAAHRKLIKEEFDRSSRKGIEPTADHANNTL